MIAFIYKLAYPFALAYWFIFRPQTTGVKCLVTSGKKILFIRNTYGPKSWTFPGGGVEKGETPEAAVLREVFEEVGIRLVSVASIGSFTHATEYKQDTIHCFSGSALDEKTIIQKEEIAECGWFSTDSLPADISSSAKKLLSLYEK